MATSELKLTFGFTDESKRDMKMGPFAPNATAITGAKSNIMSFNQNDLNSVKGLILSDDGASCTGIIDAEIITTDKTEFNLND